MKRVSARATRSGRWWAIDVPEIPGLFTQVRRLTDAAPNVIEAAKLLGVVVDEVEIIPQLDAEIQALVEMSLASRAEAARAEAEASRATRDVISELRRDELTVREIATIVGLSHQRVATLSR